VDVHGVACVDEYAFRKVLMIFVAVSAADR
jgi:hypothetical protein